MEPLETLVNKMKEETSCCFGLRKFIVHGRFMSLILAFDFALKKFKTCFICYLQGCSHVGFFLFQQRQQMHEDRMKLELAIRGFILSNFTIYTKICTFPSKKRIW